MHSCKHSYELFIDPDNTQKIRRAASKVCTAVLYTQKCVLPVSVNPVVQATHRRLAKAPGY